MLVAAFIGQSGSGKTTLIAALIRHFVTKGRTVAAIKHTHHALNTEHRGDTAVFAEAGADPVILAGDHEAILFGAERFAYPAPAELLARCDTDIVFVEGFKNVDAWPRIELDRACPLSVEGALTILGRIWRAR
ncbi:MAG TPA: molybdopterin-guanine dinucleotide biosynthesis protein B [Thermoanaerobaculia bacterium]